MPSITVFKKTTDDGGVRSGKVDIGETSVDKKVILRNLKIEKTVNEPEPGTVDGNKIDVSKPGPTVIGIDSSKNYVERQFNGRKWKITNQDTINKIKARARKLRLLKAEKENKGSKGASRTSKEK